MELEVASRRPPLVRMVDQDRVSQASSVATISYIPVRMEHDGKVQNFGKRCQAAKRDPNCPVVIRGWLNKKDSSGLKLWKRRWFVLSNYCLYYYKAERSQFWAVSHYPATIYCSAPHRNAKTENSPLRWCTRGCAHTSSAQTPRRTCWVGFVP
ncbi:pleckstrin homology domain-containing family A member 7-like isoform 2-T2 [Synchiropus picturatus]